MKLLNNMEKRIVSFKFWGLLFVIIALSLAGCNQKEEQQKPEMQSLQSEEQSDKPPEQLEEIESSIEKIIKALKGPAIGVKEEKEEGEEGKEEEKGKQSTEQGGGQNGQEGKDKEKKGEENQNEEGGQEKEGEQKDKGNEQSKQDTKGQGEQETKQKDPWQKITPVINDLHYKWNSYMPMAVKMGANRELVDGFSDALNSLTSTIIGKNETNTLMAASYLYAYVPDLYGLYKTKTSPEIKRIRYYTRNAMLNAMTANWEQADYDINSLKSSWSLFKNTIPKKQQEDANRLDFSIYELEKVITERSQPLTDIKGRVVMSNIESVEKAMEKESEEGGGQGGQEGGQSSGKE